MRLSNKLLREMDTTLRRFNAKVRRLEKQASKDIIVPARVTKQELLNYENTNDIRRRLRSLQRFSRRGVERAMRLEGGDFVSIWEKKEHDILKRTAMRKLNKEIAYMETHNPKVYGKKQDVSFAKTGDETYLRLSAERNRLKTKNILTKSILERENRIAKRILYSRNHQFRENYYKMLQDVGSMLGQGEKVEEIKAQLDKLSDEEFVKFFNDDKGISAITFFYQTIEDGIFHINYEYIENNFNLIAEHLNDESSIEDYMEMTKRGTGWRKTFNDYAREQIANVESNTVDYFGKKGKYKDR